MKGVLEDLNPAPVEDRLWYSHRNPKGAPNLKL